MSPLREQLAAAERAAAEVAELRTTADNLHKSFEVMRERAEAAEQRYETLRAAVCEPQTGYWLSLIDGLKRKSRFSSGDSHVYAWAKAVLPPLERALEAAVAAQPAKD